MSGMNSDNNLQDKFNSYFKGLYNRNKTILVISIVIYLASLFVGIVVGYFSLGFTKNFLAYLARESTVELTTFSLFMHNLQAVFLSYFGGLIIIIPAVALAFNGFIYGAFIGFLLYGGISSNYGVLTVGDFIVYTIPHGILEIPGFIITGTAGFRLATLVVGVLESIIKDSSIKVHYWKLEDSFAFLIIAIILIFIAAIIEANITVSLGNYITGLHLPVH
jgi:uncharacterized membrane protein SpoIIM required for sporulation